MYYPNMKQYRQDFSRVMTVTGNASLPFDPDKVSIQLEVVTESEQLSQAQQENARKMNQVIQSLVQLGIPKENIQTTAYNIFPVYDYIDGKQQFKEYRVSNTITIQITDITQAGTIIDVAVQNGVNQVSNIQFSIEDKQNAYHQALSAALKNAIAEAQVIAETLNISFDPTPIKIVEETIETPPSFKTYSTAEASVSTPIEPGQIIVSAAVKTKFQY
ncbi:SIMPL domain-containing protein [Virgibacillus necropolis]|uniref:SIMPL domain-containing protein n=1 Tax=Virgibacillus necropolis TaxID=163877 RepID=UPI00384DC099